MFNSLDVHVNVQVPFATWDFSSLGKQEQPRETPPSFHAGSRGATPQAHMKRKHHTWEPSRQQETAGTRTKQA